jgi:large subunit ribosomal protein L19
MKKKFEAVLADLIRSERMDAVKPGNGVRVHVRIREGDKERIQVFAGIVIARKGSGVTETFTVRHISFGVGVEKIFPIHSPYIEKIEVERESAPMRAKLYYMRKRRGKQAMKVRQLVRG